MLYYIPYVSYIYIYIVSFEKLLVILQFFVNCYDYIDPLYVN